LSFIILKSKLPSSKPFGNAGATNEGNLGNFTPKLVAMVTSLWLSEKQGRIYNLRSNAYNLVKVSRKSFQ